MQRTGLRATVAGVPVDVPTGPWTAGQDLRFDGTQITTVPHESGAIMIATQAVSTPALTMVDVTALTLALALGTYEFTVKGLWQSAAITTGLKVSCRMATGAANAYTGACAIVTGAAGDVECQSQTTFSSNMGSVTGPAAGVSVPFDYWGRLTVTAAGNFAIQFATEVNLSAVTLQVGTMLEIAQVA